MPQPEGVQLTHNISPMLTIIAGGFLPDLQAPTDRGGMGFIAKQVFPNVPVAAPAGIFPVWKRGDFVRRQMKKMANYEAPPIIGFTSGTGNYAVDHFGIATMYTRKDLANARVGGMTDQAFINAKTKLVTIQPYLELEMQTAALVQTNASWNVNITGVASAPGANQILQWDQAASDPVADINALREQMRLTVGYTFNCMILPVQILNILMKNQSLIDRIKYGGTMDRPTEVTLEQIKALFRINKILIPEGTYNAAPEGLDDSFSYIWGSKVWLGYVASAPSIYEPSAGYHFSWNGDVSAGLPSGIEPGEGPENWGSVKSEEGIFIREYLENRPSGKFIESDLYSTPNIVAKDMGMLISSVVGG